MILDNINSSKIKLFLSKRTYNEKMILNLYIKNKWSNDTIYFLENGKLSKEKQEEVDKAENLERWTTGRSLETYLMNIISGWLVEDFLKLFHFNNYNDKAFDSDREFHFKEDMFKSIGRELDGETNGRKIDIMSSWTDYVRENESISLMFEKYKKMKDQQAILYIYDIFNDNLLRIDVNDDIISSEKIFINKEKNIYKYECSFDYEKQIVPIKKKP